MTNTNYCKLTLKRYELKEGTKTVWTETEHEEKLIDEIYYNNIVTAAPFMRRLGGSESLKKTYTCRGYKVFEIISKSPDRTAKTTYNFDFNI